jgi:hypothetical protein
MAGAAGVVRFGGGALPALREQRETTPPASAHPPLPTALVDRYIWDMLRMRPGLPPARGDR